MLEIKASPESITSCILSAAGQNVSLLDSCGRGTPGSSLLIVGINPVEVSIVPANDVQRLLDVLDDAASRTDAAAVFTLSYNVGRALIGRSAPDDESEPGLCLALYDSLIIHDYSTGRSFITGNEQKFGEIERMFSCADTAKAAHSKPGERSKPASNLSREQYEAGVERIKEYIRAGDTYQTNLTQQISVRLDDRTPAKIFTNLRRDHPARFAAYLDRGDSFVVSASPEQFFRIESSAAGRRITAEPIKGTRPRGANAEADDRLRFELLSSEKDRAENTMIVDLMRNDLGRVCEFGTVSVESLCIVEEHPTLFHLVSAVSGTLRPDARLSDVIRALFPCGSITGAPKIRTMQIIDELETACRGLSMGAIGCCVPKGLWNHEIIETSVAIRTMVIRDGTATFNVGGGVVIDSDARAEYAESMLKAKALLRAIEV